MFIQAIDAIVSLLERLASLASTVLFILSSVRIGRWKGDVPILHVLSCLCHRCRDVQEGEKSFPLVQRNENEGLTVGNDFVWCLFFFV